MSIYVEVVVDSPLDALWTHTQRPELHELWDLRFTTIDYLPRPGNEEPQRFRYTTRIGFGFQISGEGETLGQRGLPDGSAISALRFRSTERLSLIREGSGYWKYVPTAQGVRFLTSYDYQPRFGMAGALFDRMIFRPLIGWATAWSFDRLRLWLDKQIDPRLAARQMLIHVVARLALSAVFAYQGIVPKVLMRHVDEISMMRAAGVPAALLPTTLIVLGVAELGLSALLLVAWCRPWPAWLCLIPMPIATIIVALRSPAFFSAAFNPFSLNICVAALAAIDLLVLSGVPSAARCRRHPTQEEA